MLSPEYIWLSLLLNEVQSADVSNPLAEAEALGRLKVWVMPAETILKSVPAVPVANNCVVELRPFKEVMPETPPDTQERLPLPSFCRKVEVAPWLDGKFRLTLLILVILPALLIWNWLLLPTDNNALGSVVPMPM